MASYCYAAVTNIPSTTRTADLRAHFSSMVEEKCFVCFHFRHRPEKNLENERSSSQRDIKRCCIVQVLKTRLRQFLAYNNQHWTDVNGQYSIDVCHISEIKLKKLNNAEVECTGDSEEIEEEKLLQMPELRPPDLMPNGNVGTPTLMFLDFIQRCLLPHSLIHKLHLEFPKTRAKRIYGNVDLRYETPESHSNEELNTRITSAATTSSMNAKPDYINKRRNINRVGSSELTSDSADKDSGTISAVKEQTDTYRSEMTNEKSFDKDLSKTSMDEKDPESASLTLSHESRDTSFRSEHLGRENTSTEISGKPSAILTKPVSEEQSAKTADTHHTGCVPDQIQNSDKNSIDLHFNKFHVPEPVDRGAKKPPELSKRQRKKLAKEDRLLTRKLMDEGIEEKLIAIEKRYHNDDDAEEWDRHEASEDDPSNQERNKERLYEEEIEQPWEKGGPGVVFYTDAMYWQEKEGDFDEQTTDDLDVDFSAYEEAGAGDKDIKDFLKIRQEQRFRNGQDSTDMFSIGIGKRRTVNKVQPDASASTSQISSRIGKFERFTKGIGRKVMEKQGWKEGQSLGSKNAGITEALKGEGQKANNKRGLGFVEEPPVVFSLAKRNRDSTQVNHITTIYDNPYHTDPLEPLLQRNEPTTLKHRQSHLDKFSRP